MSQGNEKWQALTAAGERQPKRNWLADPPRRRMTPVRQPELPRDQREPVGSYRQLMARVTADRTTEEDSIQRVLAMFWSLAPCETCGDKGPCSHRDRKRDLADVERERLGVGGEAR